MPNRQCFLCGNQFQFGPQTYLGMQVKPGHHPAQRLHAWQRGGIVPALYPQLVEHLKVRGISPDYDDHGWIRWPLEQHAIVRHLPETAGMPQYEIRSDADGHARIVREDQFMDL